MIKKTSEYFKELLEQHPYKQVGNRDSYSQYNEGWQDALDLAIQVVGKIRFDDVEYAVNKAAENVNFVQENYIDENGLWDRQSTFEIDKQSILKTIDEIKEELKDK